jgi:hypothetical protein
VQETPAAASVVVLEFPLSDLSLASTDRENGVSVLSANVEVNSQSPII